VNLGLQPGIVLQCREVEDNVQLLSSSYLEMSKVCPYMVGIARSSAGS
jgi:hypothetical protein